MITIQDTPQSGQDRQPAQGGSDSVSDLDRLYSLPSAQERAATAVARLANDALGFAHPSVPNLLLNRINEDKPDYRPIVETRQDTAPARLRHMGDSIRMMRERKIDQALSSDKFMRAIRSLISMRKHVSPQKRSIATAMLVDDEAIIGGSLIQGLPYGEEALFFYDSNEAERDGQLSDEWVFVRRHIDTRQEIESKRYRIEGDAIRLIEVGKPDRFLTYDEMNNFRDRSEEYFAAVTKKLYFQTPGEHARSNV